MKSYILAAPGEVECAEMPSPAPGPGEMLVDIRAALTCGTDLKTYRRGHPKIPLPSPFGHEFSGTVAAIGEGVDDFAVGDAVMAVHTAPCGECFYCAAGQENLCESIMETKVLGAFSEQILLPSHIVERNVFAKPDGLSFEEAAFLEPLACVVYGDRVQQIRPGETVVIVGAGPIGLLFLLLVKARGARGIVLGKRESRLQLARELGAELVVDVEQEVPIPLIRKLTEGRGADQVIECTGRPAVWESTLQMVRKGGRILLYGGCPGGTEVRFDTGRLHYDEIRLDGVFHFTPAAVAEARELLVSGTVDVAPLISGRYPLDELEVALERLLKGDGLKYALVPEV